MNKVILAALIGCGMTTVASAADIEIRACGSTAGRAETFTTISNAVRLGAVAPQIVGNSGSGVQAISGVWTNDGGPFAGKTIDFRAVWTGSASGQGQLLAGTTLAYVTPGNVAAPAAPNLAFSDVYQASTIHAGNPTQLIDQNVLVLPFVFARNNQGVAASVTGVTSDNLIQIGQDGTVALGVFSGNPADSTKVHLVGRDAGSGTRITVLAETGYGIGNNIFQWATNGVSATLTAQSVNVGYSSGGSVRNTLNNNLSPAVAAIGYLGLSDAAGLTGGSTVVPFNGNTYSKNAVVSGKYSLWCYFHMMNLPADDAALSDFKAHFATLIDATGAASTVSIDLGSMSVIRFADGGDVIPLY